MTRQRQSFSQCSGRGIFLTCNAQQSSYTFIVVALVLALTEKNKTPENFTHLPLESIMT